MSAYTQAQLDALREAAATGVLRVMVDGKLIIYKSTAEMLQMIRIMEQSLGTTGAAVTYYNPTFSKGV